MGETLKVDTEKIASAASKLRTINRRLESAKTDSESLSGMIPVQNLRSVAMDFSRKWDLNREQVVEELGQLQEQLNSIAEAFESVDTGLTEQLEGNCETTPAQ